MRTSVSVAGGDPDGLPTNRSLIKATLLAIGVAAVLLFTAILPAEYGVDPTGIGSKLGLTKLHAADAAADVAISIESADAVDGPLVDSEQVYRSEEMSLRLAPRTGAEIKAVMESGQTMVFDWRADGGSVYVDMHGQPPNAGDDEFTSFRIAEQLEGARAAFTAPFKGSHGWYWENKGTAPVTITLKTTGFYETLYMP